VACASAALCAASTISPTINAVTRFFLIVSAPHKMSFANTTPMARSSLT
jgi:hypothetical protein